MQNILKIFFFLLLAQFAITCSNPAPQPSFGVCRKLADFPAISEAGYDYVEVNVGDFLVPGKNDSAFNVNLEQMKQLDAKIVSCINFIPGNLKITGTETRHDEILVWADSAFRRARIAGIGIIVFGSGNARKIPEGFDRQEATQQFVDLCKRMAQIAQKYDVTVVIEPLNSGETNIINSLAEGAAIVEAVNHPNIQLLCDIFHMLRENEPAEEIVKYGSIIRHCHIAEKETRSAPGVKSDDFTQYFNALKKINYSGCISIEASDWGDDFQKHLAPALKYMKQLYE